MLGTTHSEFTHTVPVKWSQQSACVVHRSNSREHAPPLFELHVLSVSFCPRQ
jgi:hypothetical protein